MKIAWKEHRYNYGAEDVDTIINRFIEGCCLAKRDDIELEKSKSNMYVVNFGPKVNKKVAFLDLPDFT